MNIFIYFVIFVSMDEKIECRSLYFLVSILRGIIFYSNRGNYTYAYHIGVEMTDHLFTLLFS
jgi:hypothetical protein